MRIVKQLNRQYIGIDLKGVYGQMAKDATDAVWVFNIETCSFNHK